MYWQSAVSAYLLHTRYKPHMMENRIRCSKTTPHTQLFIVFALTNFSNILQRKFTYFLKFFSPQFLSQTIYLLCTSLCFALSIFASMNENNAELMFLWRAWRKVLLHHRCNTFIPERQRMYCVCVFFCSLALHRNMEVLSSSTVRLFFQFIVEQSRSA